MACPRVTLCDAVWRAAPRPSLQVRVLLVLKTTAGGAAGLTLTAATTAFLLEPDGNPGLEVSGGEAG
jgi:hypothetical protein